MNKSESKYFHTAERMDEALLSLLLEKDFEYITVKDICTRAGVNRSTFYLHYESVADLLEEAVALIHRRYQQRFPHPVPDSASITAQPKKDLFLVTDRWLLPWLDFVKENRRIYRAIHAQIDVFGAEHTYKNYFQNVFSPILSRHGIAAEKHEYIMEFYRHGLVSIMLKWVEADCRESTGEIAEIIKLCVGHAANEKANERFPIYRQETRSLFAAIGTAGGFAATALFALCNGCLGIWYSSLWHGSICIYYILLSLLRGILLAAERNARRKERKIAENYRKRVFAVTSGIVLAMNAALITPTSLMVLDQRPIQTGLIPAIASAAYTTYKISAAAVKLKRTNGTMLDQELSMVRLVDALVSILVLQNTLILAVDGSISPKLFRLTAVSSAGILLLIGTISAAWFMRGLVLYRKKS